MSWLIALYILYYGKELERWGFTKGQLPNDIEESNEFIQLQKLYKNPEIRRQFPTMYSYYLAEMEKKQRMEEFERRGEEQDPNSQYKIGGIDTKSTSYDPLIDDDPTSTFINQHASQQAAINESLVRRFMSLNKM